MYESIGTSMAKTTSIIIIEETIFLVFLLNMLFTSSKGYYI